MKVQSFVFINMMYNRITIFIVYDIYIYILEKEKFIKCIQFQAIYYFKLCISKYYHPIKQIIQQYDFESKYFINIIYICYVHTSVLYF